VSAWAEVNSEPERFIIAGNGWSLFAPGFAPEGSNRGQDVSLADVYTVRNGRVVEMQAFAGRQEALRGVGAEAERDR